MKPNKQKTGLWHSIKTSQLLLLWFSGQIKACKNLRCISSGLSVGRWSLTRRHGAPLCPLGSCALWNHSPWTVVCFFFCYAYICWWLKWLVKHFTCNLRSYMLWLLTVCVSMSLQIWLERKIIIILLWTCNAGFMWHIWKAIKILPLETKLKWCYSLLYCWNALKMLKKKTISIHKSVLGVMTAHS